MDRLFSFVHDKTTYDVLFPTMPLFSIELQMVSSTYFVQDIHLLVIKLHPKSLK